MTYRILVVSRQGKNSVFGTKSIGYLMVSDTAIRRENVLANKLVLSEQQLIALLLRGKLKLSNATVVNGKLEGTECSLNSLPTAGGSCAKFAHVVAQLADKTGRKLDAYRVYTPMGLKDLGETALIKLVDAGWVLCNAKIVSTPTRHISAIKREFLLAVCMVKATPSKPAEPQPRVSPANNVQSKPISNADVAYRPVTPVTLGEERGTPVVPVSTPVVKPKKPDAKVKMYSAYHYKLVSVIMRTLLPLEWGTPILKKFSIRRYNWKPVMTDKRWIVANRVIATEILPNIANDQYTPEIWGLLTLPQKRMFLMMHFEALIAYYYDTFDNFWKWNGFCDTATMSGISSSASRAERVACFKAHYDDAKYLWNSVSKYYTAFVLNVIMTKGYSAGALCKMGRNGERLPFSRISLVPTDELYAKLPTRGKYGYSWAKGIKLTDLSSVRMVKPTNNFKIIRVARALNILEHMTYSEGYSHYTVDLPSESELFRGLMTNGYSIEKLASMGLCFETGDIIPTLSRHNIQYFAPDFSVLQNTLSEHFFEALTTQKCKVRLCTQTRDCISEYCGYTREAEPFEVFFLGDYCDTERGTDHFFYRSHFRNVKPISSFLTQTPAVCCADIIKDIKNAGSLAHLLTIEKMLCWSQDYMDIYLSEGTQCKVDSHRLAQLRSATNASKRQVDLLKSIDLTQNVISSLTSDYGLRIPDVRLLIISFSLGYLDSGGSMKVLSHLASIPTIASLINVLKISPSTGLATVADESSYLGVLCLAFNLSKRLKKSGLDFCNLADTCDTILQGTSRLEPSRVQSSEDPTLSSDYARFKELAVQFNMKEFKQWYAPAHGIWKRVSSVYGYTKD